MAPSSRDRITVDLCGLKAALIERAKAEGASPSDLVRRLLAQALEVDSASGPLGARPMPSGVRGRVRVCIRFDAAEAYALCNAACSAGLPLGVFISSVVSGLPLLCSPASAAQHQAALVASCAELATLSRNLRHLTDLLRQGSVQAAAEYRQTLETASVDIRAHLADAGDVLNDLRPQQRRADAARRHSHQS
jgi:hypothetical protein